MESALAGVVEQLLADPAMQHLADEGSRQLVDDEDLAWDLVGGQVLARLPKRTIVINMGRYGAFYKVEAPNGAVGYLRSGAVSATPVLDY